MSDSLSPPTDPTLVARSRVLRGGALVAAALAAGNLLGYAFNLVASRALSPAGFGEVGALLGLVLIGNVAALGLQAVAARHVALVLARATRDTSTNRPRAQLKRLSAGTALGVGVLIVLASPALAWFLHLDSVAPVLLVSAALVSLIHLGTLLGLLQGEERMTALALLYLTAALGKVGGGLLGLALQPTVTAALAGTATGSLLAVVVGEMLIRRSDDVRPSGAGLRGLAHLPRELAHASGALLALFLLTNLDLLAARHWLSAPEAGRYALGAVIAKGCFWLPQFVSVVAFPWLARTDRRASTLRAAAVVVVTLGVTAVTLVALAPSTIVRLVGGEAYEPLAPAAWMFAAAGSTFALAHLLLMARLAASDSRAVAAVWVVVAIEIAAFSLFHGSVGQVAGSVLAAAVTLCCIGAVAEAHDRRRRLLPVAAKDQSDGIAADHGASR